MKDLTYSDVVTWCRHQAQKFNRIADDIETTFQSNATMPFAFAEPIANSEERATLIVQRVRDALELKNRRFKDLERMTGTTERELRKLLTPDRGFELGDRGWVKLAPKNGQ